MLNSTLACLVKLCQNKRTTVELRNESFVTGRVGSCRLKKGFHLHISVHFQIVQSDGFMNITLEDVLFTDALGSKTKFDSFFVQNRLIR